jgi:hypothetical protein
MFILWLTKNGQHFSFSSWEGRVPVSPGRGRQTEIKDKAGLGREQNSCVFLTQWKQSLLLNKRGRPFILYCLGKGKDRLRIGGKEFPGSTHEGLLVSLQARCDLQSWAMETMKEAQEI